MATYLGRKVAVVKRYIVLYAVTYIHLTFKETCLSDELFYRFPIRHARICTALVTLPWLLFSKIQQATNWWSFPFSLFPENRVWYVMRLYSKETICTKCQTIMKTYLYNFDPFIYSQIGVYRGIHYFSFFCLVVIFFQYIWIGVFS